MKKIILSKWFLIPAILILTLVALINYNLAYDGTAEYVTIKSNDIEIKGVLVRPNRPGPHPGIILLQGAGGSHQDYDKWYNRFHTNEFVNRGFAVLSYTKRGSGNNGIDYQNVTFNDLINDAVSVITFLRKQPQIDSDKIGLFGVSESGWLTPEIVKKDGNIKFIINRVSSPKSWRETVIHEVRVEAAEFGFSEKEIEEEIIPMTLRRWQFYIDANRDNASITSERIALNQKLKELHSQQGFQDWFEEELPDYNSGSYAVRAQKYSYDPQPFMKEIEVPMLYIFGGKDVNIPTEKCVNFLNEFKAGYKKDITIKIYPDAGHYLYRWKLFPVEGFYEPGYLDFCGSWAAKQVAE